MTDRIRVFGAPFFVDEHGLESQLCEDYPERVAVCDFGFRFHAAFVSCRGIVVPGQTLVCKHPAVAVPANAQNGLPSAQSAVGCVIERVVLESTRRHHAKAKRAEVGLKLMKIFNAELHLGFNCAHAASISRLPGDNSGMRTLRLCVDPADLNSNASCEAIARAAAILRDGGTVAFPTETVYGLGANALNEMAVAKIFAAKQRPRWDPLIVHLADRDVLSRVARDVPENALRLMDAFWPGPLTLLLPRSAAIPDAVTAGRPLVGVRAPRHPVTHALLVATGLPIAAPSANSFGRTSPTLAAHVAEDLDGRIDAILDSGEATYGLESTVIDPSANPCVVYRPGVITIEQIRAICPGAVIYQESRPGSATEPEALPSPGVGIRHYAPKAKLILVEAPESFAEKVRAVALDGEKLGLMLPDGFPVPLENDVLIYRWGEWTNEEELAHRLFAGLRWLDASGVTAIICPMPGDGGIGSAIRDRLRKAARE